jgi:TIR domain
MAEVFISYASAERALIESLAKDLREAGFSVWWDTDLLPNHTFRSEIDRQLDACKAAIIIWTPLSISRPWVLAEADHARGDAGHNNPLRRANKLVNTHSPDLHARDIPKPFNQVHSVSLDDRSRIILAIEALGARRNIKTPLSAAPDKKPRPETPTPAKPAGAPASGHAQPVTAAKQRRTFVSRRTALVGMATLAVGGIYSVKKVVLRGQDATGASSALEPPPQITPAPITSPPIAKMPPVIFPAAVLTPPQFGNVQHGGTCIPLIDSDRVIVLRSAAEVTQVWPVIHKFSPFELWSISQKKIVDTFREDFVEKGPSGDNGGWLSASRDGRFAASTRRTHSEKAIRDVVHVWNATDHSLFFKLPIEYSVVSSRSAIFSPDGRYFGFMSTRYGAVSEGRFFCVWDLRQKKLVRNLSRSETIEGVMAFSNSGDVVLIADQYESGLQCWNFQTGEMAYKILDGKVRGRSICAASDAPYVLVSTGSGPVQRLRFSDGGLMGTAGEGSAYGRVALSPDGRLAACEVDSATFALWDVVAGKLAGTCKQPSKSIAGLAFCSDNKHVVSLAENGAIYYWEFPES